MTNITGIVLLFFFGSCGIPHLWIDGGDALFSLKTNYWTEMIHNLVFPACVYEDSGTAWIACDNWAGIGGRNTKWSLQPLNRVHGHSFTTVCTITTRFQNKLWPCVADSMSNEMMATFNISESKLAMINWIVVLPVVIIKESLHAFTLTITIILVIQTHGFPFW